jgi:large subunit ribosomal protein L21
MITGRFVMCTPVGGIIALEERRAGRRSGFSFEIGAISSLTARQEITIMSVHDLTQALRREAAMFAIFETGGKQYGAKEGDRLKVEKLPGSVGDVVEFGKVLFARTDEAVRTGNPYVENASLSATILGEGRSRKVLIFKKKRRKQYKRLRGHRQEYTEVRIDKITVA